MPEAPSLSLLLRPASISDSSALAAAAVDAAAAAPSHLSLSSPYHGHSMAPSVATTTQHMINAAAHNHHNNYYYPAAQTQQQQNNIINAAMEHTSFNYGGHGGGGNNANANDPRAAIPFPSITNMAGPPGSAGVSMGGYPQGVPAAIRYGPESVPLNHQLYTGYPGSAFEPSHYIHSPSTHIPINNAAAEYSPMGPSSLAASTRNIIPRPQPTRPLIGPDMTAKDPSMPPPSLAASRSQSSTSSSSYSNSLNLNNSNSPANSTSASAASSSKDKMNNGNNNHNYSSVMNSSNNNLGSPAAVPSPASPASSNGGKYRYPSGQATVQSSLSASSPATNVCGLPVGRSTTPSSAMSSREGTPLPNAIKAEDAAPNVDISRVQIKDSQLLPPAGDFSPPAVPPLGGTPSAFAQHFGRPSPNNAAAGSRFSYFGNLGDSVAADGSSTASGSTAGSDNNGNPSGATAGVKRKHPGQSHHGHVIKIGRRPAHLPKVLKFSDKTLPPGWIRKLKQRKHGKQAGRWDVYIYSPCGVKFASRKKLKGFFEKNNLTHDPEDFDFTPYGRHIDGRVGNSSGDSSTASSCVRHNSSGSTGSDGTHAGSSPASISNYSPTHPGSHLGYLPSGMPSAAATAVHGPMIPPAGIISPFTASSVGDYSFAQFDPHMESPPNASALDIPHGAAPPEFSPAAAAAAAAAAVVSSASSSASALPYLPGGSLGRGHHHPIMSKDSISVSEFFPTGDMADIDILGGGGVSNGYSTVPSSSAGGTSSSFLTPHDLVRTREDSSSSSHSVDVKPVLTSASASPATTSLSMQQNSNLGMQQQQQQQQHHHHNQHHHPHAAALVVSSASPGQHGQHGGQDSQDVKDGFSLGGAMRALNSNQGDGGYDYYSYDTGEV